MGMIVTVDPTEDGRWRWNTSDGTGSMDTFDVLADAITDAMTANPGPDVEYQYPVQDG